MASDDGFNRTLQNTQYNYDTIMNSESFRNVRLQMLKGEYPQKFEAKWNYLEYINDAEAELTPKNYVWQIDKEKQWSSDEQYLEWLYFRRRQGFGKTKWTQHDSKIT